MGNNLNSNSNTEKIETSDIIFLHKKVDEYNECLKNNLLKQQNIAGRSTDKKNLDIKDINKNLSEIIKKHKNSLEELNNLLDKLSVDNNEI